MAPDTDTGSNSTTDSTASDRASADDFLVARDENDEIQPVEEPTQMFGTVLVKPMPYGAIESRFGDAGQVSNVDSDVIASVINDFVVEPDFSAAAGGDVTGEFIRENMKPLGPRDLIMAILSASDVSAEVTVDQNANAQVAIDEGNLS